MSHAQGGTNGYVSGTYPRAEDSRNGDSIPEGGPVSAPRFQRAGGYGGFLSETPSVLGIGSSTHAGSHLYNEDPSAIYSRRSADGGVQGYGAHERSQSRERNGRETSNARTHGTGPGGRQIEGVLQHVEEYWDIMTKDDCVPVHVALQLMDYSSLGRGNDYQDFQRTSQQLQKGLKSIVNEHHQGFNSSIGTFHKIQSSIQISQARVRALKDSIRDAKANLMVPKPELREMGTSSQSYDETILILGQIEHLQSIPEQLDAKISEKHFLLAVDLLHDALRLIRRSDMENIGALTDLRIYFSNQETSLTDILIEELHDHVYLKSPYCQDRWRPFTNDALTGLALESNAITLAHTLRKPLYRFLDGLDTSIPMEEEASTNPETDSFQYIYLILESLNKLGHLDTAVETIEQRLPVELYAVVDKTNQEVALRHMLHLRNPGDVQDEPSSLFQQDGGRRKNILNDFLWTLYSKFEAVAEGHRAVHDVVVGVAKRKGLANWQKLSGGFKELWKLYQSEMRSLLHDYLATDGDTSSRLGRVQNTERNVFQQNHRDKSKRVFRLAELDHKSADLATEQGDLDQILKASVPGLVSKSRRLSGNSESTNTAVDGPAAGHRLIVDPDVFNISLLLPPSLSFLQRLKDIVPPDSDIARSTLTSFLDDFLVNVFQPQLEETVTELCTESFVKTDAFTIDPQWAQKASRPLFKGASALFTLILAFCKLLQSIPHDPAFAQLLVAQTAAYYDRCSEWYKVLVARPRTQQQDGLELKPAAAMAETGEVRAVTEQLLNSSGTAIDELDREEHRLLLSANQQHPFQPRDIVSDHGSVSALCILYNSMTWLASRLSSLGRIVSEPSPTSSKSAQTRRWTLLNLETKTSSASIKTPYLSLTSSTATSFEQTLSSMRSLARTVLLTLHLDIRAGVIHMLSRTLAAPYLLAQPTQEPDSSVLTLNHDLVSFDDTLKSHLDTREHTFIINGICSLIDTALVSLTPKHVTSMNADGCARMQLNILVLQQNLKAVEADAVLTRSVEYFDLFTQGASGIVALVKEGGKKIGFTLEELKGLVELSYSEALRSEGREGAVAARKGLNSELMELSEVLWDT